MDNVSNEPGDIKESDIVFDCPSCQKSLAIDYRGAGLTITCPDCEARIQVPIPEGMEVSDIDSSSEDQEVRIIHMREVLSASQNRLSEIESELQDLEHRREALERIRSENAIRFDVIGREVEAIQRSLVRIAEVLESAAEAARKNAATGVTAPG